MEFKVLKIQRCKNWKWEHYLPSWNIEHLVVLMALVFLTGASYSLSSIISVTSLSFLLTISNLVMKSLQKKLSVKNPTAQFWAAYIFCRKRSSLFEPIVSLERLNTYILSKRTSMISYLNILFLPFSWRLRNKLPNFLALW